MKPERDAPSPPSQTDRELLTAYIDGIAELSTDERRRVEAQLAVDPEARADEGAVRGLLDQLRAMPPAGNEPDWAAMECSIRDAVGPEAPRAWWRRWQWLVPLSTCVTAAGVLFALWSRPSPREASFGGRPVQESRTPRADRADTDLVPLWLDGTEVDVDPSASDLLGSMVGSVGEDETAAPDGELGALSPSTNLGWNLGWIDRLDDAAVDRAERWLATVDSRPVPGPAR